MSIVIAVLIGILVATGSAVALVHDQTVVRSAPVRMVFNYGSG